ncbi:conjugal transfer protein TraN [Alcanivorax sp.]|uniref:conjugal transfer protein TraN n=1 Tax=Alcanivorax sp. TaxID=1872427 RepID=UPI00258CE6DE|nr:conjugal transfer protein TraN [Alcanivorax sp.]
MVDSSVAMVYGLCTLAAMILAGFVVRNVKELIFVNLGMALVLFGGSNVVAADPNADGKAFAESMRGSVNNSATNANPEDVPYFEGQDVPETQFYNSGAGIEDQARREAAEDETAQYVIKSHNERPPVEIDRETDPLFINYEEIEDKAHSLTNGYAGCVDLPVGSLGESDEFVTCDISGEFYTHTSLCDRKYSAECQNEYFNPYSEVITIGVASRGRNYVTVVVDLKNNSWTKVKPSDGTSVYVKLPVGLDYDKICNQRKTSISRAGVVHWWGGLSHVGGSVDTSVYRRILQDPTCENGLVAKLQIQDIQWGNTTAYSLVELFKFRFSYEPVCNELYQEGFTCPDVDGYSDAQYVGRECLDDEPKMVGGFEVSKDCWHWQESYEKKKFRYVESSECSAFEEAGCGFIGQECTSAFPGGECQMVSRKYSCSDADSDRTVQMCAEVLDCQGGDCAEEYKQSIDATEDFKRAATSSAVANEIASQFDFDTVSVFSGDDKTCKKHDFGYMDCCKDSGWGGDIGFSECSTEEQELGLAKEADSTHYVGKYESGSWPDERTYKVYCVYPSKLARIIVEQGNKQLGRNYGSAKSPRCYGFTLEELEELDFEKMDLSEFYEDVEQAAANGSVPNPAAVTAELKEKIEQMGGQ